MSHFIEAAPNGRIIMYTNDGTDLVALNGGAIVQVDREVDTRRTMYLDGELVDFGPRPSLAHFMDPATRTWEIVQTDAEKIEAVRVRLQRVMDDAARALGYDDIKTAITYADEPAVPKFQGEGQAFRTWRSLVWDACYAHPAMSGNAPIPTPDEAEALMPALVLPA